jgi:hypothetical protein
MMYRNSLLTGYPFRDANEATKRAVWAKGRTIPGWDSAKWRRDICGATMSYDQHGQTQSEFGWEIDHIRPTSKDGGDELSNLQPLHWENNRAKGDTFPWRCENAK